MADKPFRCKLITPHERVFDADISYAMVPLWDGKIGFMAHAAALVGKLGPGELRINFVDRYTAGVKVEESGAKRWFIEGGFVQNVKNELTILATGAHDAESLDESEAKAELAEAVARIPGSPAEMPRITADRQRARAKLEMIHTGTTGR